VSERLTNEVLVELIGSFESAIAEQRARVPAHLAGAVEKTFNTADWILDGLTELRDRRAADLTEEEREALRVLAARTVEVDGLIYGEHMIRALRIERDEWGAKAKERAQLAMRRAQDAKQVERVIAKIVKRLALNGCDCDCEHRPDEHTDECERCLACYVGAALAGEQIKEQP
jgi:hypothetical protein